MYNADLIVIGGGAAALAAAYHAARLGLDVHVLCDLLVGGQVLNVEEVINYPGAAEGISGAALTAEMERQARQAGARFTFSEVEAIEVEASAFAVRCGSDERTAPAVVVATGSSLRHLDVPGEALLHGHGVSYCASCDGPLFAGRDVVVIGGGDSAVEEVLAVVRYAKRAHLVVREDNLHSMAASAARVVGHDQIDIVTGTEVVEIVGDSMVTGVRIREVDGGRERTLNAEGVFVYAGLVPNTSMLRGIVDLDEHCHVRTSAWMETNVPGLFAAGDIRADSPRQLVNAASDGVTAAIAAHRYLRRN